MKSYWKVAPGRQAVFWRDCFENKCIAINWLNQDDLKLLQSPADFEDALLAAGEGGSNDARSIYQFVHEMNKGDIVIANDGKSKVKGIGVIRSEYLSSKDRRNPFRPWDRNTQVRLVDWKIAETVELDQPVFNIPTVQRLTEEHILPIKTAYAALGARIKQVLDELLPLGLPAESSYKKRDDYQPNAADERQATYQQVMLRRGQQAFRKSLLDLHQSTCMVTGCKVVDLLEAAHISPYRGKKDNHIEYGLLLRADIHTLFDVDLLAIEPATLKIILQPHVATDEHYAKFSGKRICCPKGWSPSLQALQQRYEQFTNANSR